MKTILVTGATGFIGKNLITKLKEDRDITILAPGRETSEEELRSQLIASDCIFHLAGVSRPQDPKEFYEGNTDYTKKIVTLLLSEGKTIPILYTSSVHATMDNDFGSSKREAEELLQQYNKKTGAPLYIVRLTNTFGRWARPNAHSVVATFCYNIAHDLEVTVSDPSKVVPLAYIDDVIESFISLILQGKVNDNITLGNDGLYTVIKIYPKTLREITQLLYRFKNENSIGSQTNDEFTQKLFSTYESYKP